LALLCGQPEKVFYLYKGCNELGAWKMGCRSERLPGGWIGEQREALECLKRMWGDDIASTQGLNAMEMLRSCEKKNLKALFLLGVDPLAVFPDTERTRKALAGMDLLIRTGTFPATGEELAHLVFPSAVLTETDGTYMNVDGRVQRSNKVANPPGGARPLARFLLDLAGHLDAAMSYPAARDIFEELCGLYEGWNALTWASVGRRGGVIPELPGAGPSSTDTSAVAEARPVPYIPPDQFPSGPQPPPHRPFRVFPEERTMYPGDGVLARRSWRLSEFDSNVDQVRMHPADCQRIGVRDGERVELRSEAGSVTARLGVDDAVPPRGVVVPSAGPSYMFQRLLSWPEQHCPVGWDRLFVSVTPVEE
ncbi:MAG: molybdopterin-dependent oxidoreductase, partial [Deltaproteobacteria bacterium]|nr:molybdopterin-dependent oxidoreductase [Deltaproteobacteria bacterium]